MAPIPRRLRREGLKCQGSLGTLVRPYLKNKNRKKGLGMQLANEFLPGWSVLTRPRTFCLGVRLILQLSPGPARLLSSASSSHSPEVLSVPSVVNPSSQPPPALGLGIWVTNYKAFCCPSPVLKLQKGAGCILLLQLQAPFILIF